MGLRPRPRGFALLRRHGRARGQRAASTLLAADVAVENADRPNCPCVAVRAVPRMLGDVGARRISEPCIAQALQKGHEGYRLVLKGVHPSNERARPTGRACFVVPSNPGSRPPFCCKRFPFRKLNMGEDSARTRPTTCNQKRFALPPMRARPVTTVPMTAFASQRPTGQRAGHCFFSRSGGQV